jgi:hypothetical protein
MDIHQWIGVLNPDVYCAPPARREVKRRIRAAVQAQDPQPYLSAASFVQLPESNTLALTALDPANPFALTGLRSPIERHTLVRDSFAESLEPVYFWLLDELTAEGFHLTKLADSFAAAPGSGLFGELVRRGAQAQQQTLRLLREAESLLNDILRTIGPAHIDPLQTISHNGSDRSEADANRLRTKVEQLRLYARWLGPYLKQARQLEQNADGGAGLVTLFNTVAMEVTLLGQRPYAVAEAVDRGELPRVFLRSGCRPYFVTLVLELKLRAAPERTSAGAYGYRGRAEIIFTS